MKIVYAFYAAHRYWPDESQLKEACAEAAAAFCGGCEYHLYWDDRTDAPPADGDCIVIIPFSGAVQQMMLADAQAYENVILCAAYIRGNLSAAVAENMLRANAAPALMDTWAVIRRKCRKAALGFNQEDLQKKLRLVQAEDFIRHARILKIGATEPWVISNADSSAVYEERFGVQIVPVAQEEVIRRYEAASQEEARPYYEWFQARCHQMLEPTEADLWAASRMTAVLVRLLEDYQAQGAALSCFQLLKSGTTMCLGVSYINDCADGVVSCEGDMDSVVTMLFMKKLTSSKLWMANPGLQPDKTINFSHCTAPICMLNKALPTVLRNHHESGIGVSLQVNVPAGLPVTACRISDNCKSITIHRGVTAAGAYEAACRTQVHVHLDDFDHYIQTALGCHQVIAFEDVAEELNQLAEKFALEVL